MQVLKTKLTRPILMNKHAMQRPQLLAEMQLFCRSSLVFIHAAAGYGKTTLMHQLSEYLTQQKISVCWLNLDNDDNDPIRLYQYLWSSLLGKDQLTSVPNGQVHKQNIIELCQSVADLATEMILFIDEFEALENPECLNILWWLYQYLPLNAHLVIASRVKPNWAFAKEYLLGRLKLVTESQLSVKTTDSEQLIQFLHQQNVDQITLTEELAEQLIEKTEGWMTGIQLTNLYLKNHHNIAQVIQKISGAHNQIVDYLSEQVFLQLSNELQDFLLEISVLRKFSLSGIHEITRNPNASLLLASMIQKGLFIHALDEQHSWYRIHHLFRDFLESRFKLFNIEHYKTVHLRAAYWYQQQHFFMEAIYHAERAENQLLVLDLLSQVSRDLVLEGRVYTLLELIKLIPEPELAKHPTLLYDIIWSLIITHQNLLANHYLQIWVDHHRQTDELIENQLSLAPMIALMSDDIEQAYQLAQQSLAKIAGTAYFVRAPLIGIGALYHIGLGKIAEARKILIQTRAIYIQGNNIYGLIFTDCIDATCDYLEGHPDKAIVKFNHIGKSEDYLKLSSEEIIRPIVEMIISSVKAYLHYELNDLTLANKSLNCFYGGEQLIIPDLAIIGYELLLRLAHIQQDIQAEQDCLTQSQICTNDWSMPRLSQTIQEMYQQYQWFDIDQRLKHISVNDLIERCHAQTNKTLSISNVLTGDDLTSYRTLIFIGQERQAIHFLEFELNRIHVYPLRQARIQLLLSFATYRLEQHQHAYQWLENALTLIEASKAIRIVLDEHPLIFELLNNYLKVSQSTKKTNKTKPIVFVEQLILSAQEKLSNSSDLTEPAEKTLLSKREVQILQKVSEGCTDIELADKVFLSVNTVKWHLRNIYTKLGVRSRLEAVNEAKKQGFIR